MNEYRCNMLIVKGINCPDRHCDKPAIWRHPKFPRGTYCEDHKMWLQQFWSENWQKIGESE